MTNLRACASDACPCCCGSGIAKGFGIAGKRCPCVTTCAFCEAPLPINDENFDEGKPRRLDGLPACVSCREKAVVPCPACKGEGVRRGPLLVPASWYSPAEYADTECIACEGTGEKRS
jgi:hypothetical protein